jgi:hypothetical protein
VQFGDCEVNSVLVADSTLKKTLVVVEDYSILDYGYMFWPNIDCWKRDPE